ncbi:PPIC-type PPIASE domain protein [Orientia chuto str. Dubai]|uniref:Parvulin-like PPIase n=1 Tax=Orientia chuto str. Dubai TaxID=1359168 RepID=A0A0F3MKG7_9RICK|nr:peptidylprolyl isomerase [Candidatus Orientia mediorientalis]KJV56278.1 PPIC-type PPIASE domain protein [Orientia chuto str. Dubai]
MIKNLITNVSIATALLLATSCQAQDINQGKVVVNNKVNQLTEQGNKIVVAYNNKQVSISDIASYFNETVGNFYAYSLQQQQALIKAYVMDKLLEEEVKKLNIENDVTFQEALKMLKRALAVQILLKKNVPTLKEDEYPFFQKQFSSTKVKISHIVLSNQEKAQEIKDKLNKGESFEKIAKEESLDKETKENGGVIERWFFQGDLPESVFALQEGGISEPIQFSKGTWQLIKLNSKAPHIPSKEEVDEYTFNLRAEKYATALYDAANVKIITDALNNIEKSETSADKQIAQDSAENSVSMKTDLNESSIKKKSSNTKKFLTKNLMQKE